MNQTITKEMARKAYSIAAKTQSTNPSMSKKNFLTALKYVKPLLNVEHINSKNGNKIKEAYSDVIIGIGITYSNLSKNKSAIKFYTKALSTHKMYINNWCLGAIYNNIGACMSDNEPKQIRLYNKSCKFDNSSLPPHVNLMNIYKRKITKETKKTDPIKLKYFKQVIDINNIRIKHNENNKTVYYINIIKYSIYILNDFDNQEKWLAIHVDKGINPLFYDLKTGENNFHDFKNKDVIINLFKLVEYSLNFLKNHLVVASPENKIFQLYQYTGINTLKNICNVNKYNKVNKPVTFHLRLYNSDYMNDPLEGKELLNQLIQNKNDSDSKIVKHLISIIYHSDNLNNNGNASNKLMKLYASHVYIASLSYVNPGDNDSMSLWNSYSDNHKGISLGLNVNVHPDKNNVNNSNNTTTNSLSKANEKLHPINKIPLNLYKISYDIDDFNNPDVLEKLKFAKNFYAKHINDSNVIKHKDFHKRMNDKLQDLSVRIKDIEDLNGLFNAMSKLSPNLLNNSQIFNLIKLSLDRIRFLSKSGVYRYEHEYRIMEEIPRYTNVHYDKGNEKLYINLGSKDSKGSNVTADLTQIVFGNRCKSYYWVPIVKKQLPNIKTFKSNIKYR